MLTFVNKGFIVEENRDYVKEVTFVGYANIHKVRMEYISQFTYLIKVMHKKEIGKEDRHEFRYEDKYKAEDAYNKILCNWRKYLDGTATTLEQKLDILLSHIDIIPGGKEYETAKIDFDCNK